MKDYKIEYGTVNLDNLKSDLMNKEDIIKHIKAWFFLATIFLLNIKEAFF